MKLYLFVAFCIIGCSTSQPPTDYSISLARRAFGQVKLDKSRNIYTKIIADTTYNVQDRVTALQTLAYQDWKIYENYNDAKNKIDDALLSGFNKSKSWRVLTQIEVERRQFENALIFANRALKEADNKNEIHSSQLAIASAVLGQNLENLKNNHPIGCHKLRNVSSSLKAILDEQPGRTLPSELLLGVSFCLNDGPGILMALQSYFHIYKNQKVEGILSKPFAIFHAILPIWNNRALVVEEKEKLINAFAQSRFYDYASLIVTSANKEERSILLNNPEIHNIVAYAEFIEDFDEVNSSFYPQIARGRTNYNEVYDDAIETIARKLWDNFQFSTKKPEYNHQLFFEEIRKRYGAEGYSGETCNYYCWLLGHTLHDETKQIEQFGYTADFRYISIGRMISRDFTSWLGATNVGGWGTDSSIVEVRDAFINEPFPIWNWVANGDKRLEMEGFSKNSITQDDEICKKDPCANPPGLPTRLKFNAAKRIYNQFKQEGLEGADLCMAFVSEYKRLKIESLTFAHEGRHSIDQRFFKEEFSKMESAEKEFRAKLSEVAFSSDPKLASTGSILGSNMGEDTDHGKANKRFRKLIVDWMTTHRTEIDRLDGERPLLPQFHLLTNEQVREMCFSADPLSK